MKTIQELRKYIDNLPEPIWLKDKPLLLTLVEFAYLLGKQDKENHDK